MVLSLGATDALAARGSGNGNGNGNRNTARQQRNSRQGRSGRQRLGRNQRNANQNRGSGEVLRQRTQQSSVQQLPEHPRLASFRQVMQVRGINVNRSIRKNNGVTLSAADHEYLDATAVRFEAEIRSKHTAVVDVRLPEGMYAKGVSASYVNSPYSGSGPTIIKLTGAEKLGGSLELVMTGGASGHVMNPHYGGRPMSEVEKYGREDTVNLTYKKPGASQSEHVVQVQSRGLVTQEGFKINPTKGTHNLYYFRTAPSGSGSGGEGSEPELRHVQIVVE